MSSQTRPDGEPAEPEQLEELVDLLHGADRLVARAVLLAGRLAASGVCETVKGCRWSTSSGWRSDGPGRIGGC